MLSTLFFDEADTSSALHVRSTRQHRVGEANVGAGGAAFVARPAMNFIGSGSVPVSSLRATLLWWLDRDAALVHLMLTSSTPGDVSYSCRKMSVEIPAPRSGIIACGVTHVREETVFAITWVTSQLEIGLLRVQLQRSSDHQSQLLLVPDGKVVLISQPLRIIEAFESETETQSFTNAAVNNENGGDVGSGTSVCACIVASLPSEKASCRLLSMIFVTNGVSLWWVEVGEDGTFTENEFAASKGYMDGVTESSRRGGISSWLPSWPWDSNRGGGQQYVAVSAVQRTQFIALLRCNGVLEFYDTALNSMVPVFSSVLWKNEVISFNGVQQWITLINKDIHVVTCIGSGETCRCVWSQFSALNHGDGFSVAEALTVIPPAATNMLLGCVVVDSAHLALLWDVGSEEDACIHPSISIGLLLHSTQQGISGMLQTVVTEKKEDRGEEDGRRWIHNRQGHVSRMSLLLKKTEVYFCHSGPLHALTSVGEELVLMEKANGGVRAHVLSHEMSFFEHLIEAPFAVGRRFMPATPNSLSLLAIHLIPAVVRDEDRPVSRDTTAFEEGVELAASCADGADNIAALLISAVQNVPVALSSGGFQLLRSSAYLQGYVPSGLVDDVAMEVALGDVLTYVDVPSRNTSFCSFSRRFVQHTVSRDLLSRIAYLLCSYIGWMGFGMAHTTSLELPRLRVMLEFLSAAYHVVTVAGPHVSSIAPNVSETVVADVLQFFLQFKREWETRGEDALFAVSVARRLQECDGIVGMRACAVWCNLLCRRYPCLQHFRILRELAVCRTTRPSSFASMCLAASFHLASLPEDIAVSFLLDSGLDIGSKKPLRTAFVNVDADEWRALLLNTSLVAKVYRVALLRCVILPGDAQYVSMSSSLVRELFLTELGELEQYMRLSGGESSRLHRALVELRLDTYMFLARASLDEANLGDVLSSLEKVLRSAAELSMTPMYLEQVASIIVQVVELAATSQEHTDALVAVTHSNVEIDHILALKWYAYIARPLAKPTSQHANVMRMRATVGLYRFLCRRHAYGQAARMMTDLASAVRSSAPCSSAVETVLKMTALAVTAAELIAPTAPLQVPEYDKEPLAFAPYGPVSYLHGSEQTASRAPLNREHLPWLRRRHFQAWCEKKMMDSRRHVDCTDLWAENPSTEAYAAAVKRFVEVLTELRLWTEARRFAGMTGFDVGVVFQEQVVDLLTSTDYTTDEEALVEWYEMIQACEELSLSSNRFDPLRRTLIVALTFSYSKTHPALLNSLEQTNCYVAMQALMEVFETLLHRQAELHRANAAANEEATCGSQRSDASHGSGRKTGCGGAAVASVAQPWLPLLEALRIGVDVLTQRPHDSPGDSGRIDASMTAGLFDPMACRAHELLNSPSLLEQLNTTQSRSVACRFLEAFDAVKREKLAGM